MSDEITPTPTSPPPAPTGLAAKLKRFWPTIPAAILGFVAAWLSTGDPSKDDRPLLVVHSSLQTNWAPTVESSHDPRLPVTVLTLTNGALATNMQNVHVRRAEIHRVSLLGFKKPDGDGIVPVAQAGVLAGVIAQTNGIDSTVLSEFRTPTNK